MTRRAVSPGRWPALGVAIAAGLAACNPVIDTWRNINGVSKNDPGPNAPYGRQLAAGETLPYPNLASVPPPPSGELSSAERRKLLQSLVADRGNTEATDVRLRADHPAPPPGPAGSAAAAKPAGSPGLASGQAQQGQALPQTPHEASLELPQLPPPPQPEAFTPAPPPPHLTAPAIPAASAGPAPRAPTGMPAAMAAAGYRPPPQVPTLPPPAPAVATVKPPPKPAVPTASTTIGEVDFAKGTVQLGGPQPALDRTVATYRRQPGRIRIVGHAGRSEGVVAQLDSFRTALDRAQAVANALAQRGVPADKIRVEAAPTAGDTGPGRAEILLER